MIVDEALVERFINVRLVPQSDLRQGPNVMRHLMNHLRQNGAIKTPDTPSPEDSYADLLSGYEANLRDVCGLAPATRKG